MQKLLISTALAIPLALGNAGLLAAQDSTDTTTPPIEAPADDAQTGDAQTGDATSTDAPIIEADPAVEPDADPGTDAGIDLDAAPVTDTTTEPAPAPAPEAVPEAEIPAVDADAEVVAVDSDKVMRQQSANELRLDWVTGATVTAPDGEVIGSISDLILNNESSRLTAAIVGVGGFLGIGEKRIAVPWDRLVVDYDANQITSDLTRDEADAAPEYSFRDRESIPAPVDPLGTAPADPLAADPADPLAANPADPDAPAAPAQ